MTWEGESRCIRWGVTTLFALAWVGLAKLLIDHTPWFIDAQGLKDQLTKAGGWMVETLAIIRTGENEKLQLGEQGALIGVGAFMAIFGHKVFSPWLHRHALASFNRDLLTLSDLPPGGSLDLM